MSTIPQDDLEQLLDQAIASLQETIHEIAEVRDVLQRVRRERGSASVTLLRDLRQDLIDLGTPLHFGSRYLYDAIQSLAAQIGASPTEPEYVLWLTGVDWQRPILNEQRRQHAAALLQWLEPYLDRVSARTRTGAMSSNGTTTLVIETVYSRIGDRQAEKSPIILRTYSRAFCSTCFISGVKCQLNTMHQENHSYPPAIAYYRICSVTTHDPDSDAPSGLDPPA